MKNIFHKSSFYILLVGSLCGIFLFFAVKKNHTQNEFDHFKEEVEKSELIFNGKMEVNERSLQGIRSFFNSTKFVSRKEFQQYVTPILKYNPYIQALEWIPLVDYKNLEKFESLAHSDGFKNFKIKEKSDTKKMKGVSKRTRYFPVYYVEPLIGNERALGFDLASNKTRNKSLILAESTGKSIATAKITLVQEKKSQSGILIFTPIYKNEMKKQILGFALGVYRVGDMIDRIIIPHIPKGINLVVYDEGLAKENLLYGEKIVDSIFTIKSKINVNGRIWNIIWQSDKNFSNIQGTWTPITIGVGIFLIFACLSTLMNFHTNKTALVEEEIKKRSAELNETRKNIDEVMNALNSSALISETDRAGIITNVNQNFIDISKYSEKELIGQNHRILKSNEHSKEFFKEMWNKISEGENWNGEIKNKRKDGSSYWVSSTIYPKMNFDGSIKGFVSIRYDITEKIEIRTKMIETRDNAIMAEKAKTEFLANMSHEIRTPMNGVLGMVQLLGDTKLTENQKDMVETIHSCGDSLLSILNDILDISKIESGKLEFETINFDLRKCIEEVLFLSSYKSSQKGLNLEFKDESLERMWFKGDVTRIRQILVNFLSNAVKFTEAGKVSISTELVEVDGDNTLIQINVTDTGIGIPKSAQEKLFTAFTQADNSTTRKFGGTGLGLSICSKLAHMMGGEVSFESTVGEGSTFSLRIRLENGAPEVDALKDKSLLYSDDEVAHGGHKVLLVEDNIINQKIAMMMLKKLGYKCEIAGNGIEALAALKSQGEEHFSLVLMDLQMPEMDGITATKKIIDEFGEERPKIIAMTANAFSEDRKKCFDAGMDDFIAKPIKINELRNAIANIKVAG